MSEQTHCDACFAVIPATTARITVRVVLKLDDRAIHDDRILDFCRKCLDHQADRVVTVILDAAPLTPRRSRSAND